MFNSLELVDIAAMVVDSVLHLLNWQVIQLLQKLFEEIHITDWSTIRVEILGSIENDAQVSIIAIACLRDKPKNQFSLHTEYFRLLHVTCYTVDHRSPNQLDWNKSTVPTKTHLGKWTNQLYRLPTSHKKKRLLPPLSIFPFIGNGYKPFFSWHIM